MKIEWALYIDDASNANEVYYESLDKTLYDTQYINHLYCVTENCNAQIRFTERKDGHKFFSTMPKQGAKHLPDCPYFLHYEGEVPRKRLTGVPVAASVSDDWIRETLLSKSRNLKNKNKPRQITVKSVASKRTVDSGEENVSIPIFDGSTGRQENTTNIRFGSVDSRFVSTELLGQVKRVYGMALKAEFIEDNDEGYGLIRLQNDTKQINAYFPIAFYADSRVTTKAALRAFLNTVDEEISNGKTIIVICFGLLENEKNGDGINVNIENHNHILVNESRYYSIITTKAVPENPYPE